MGGSSSNTFCILTVSWGRWKDILTHGRFKWPLNEKDMEMICRALLVYCVKHYKGDEKIKSFIWELITPSKDGQVQTLQNHSGKRGNSPAEVFCWVLGTCVVLSFLTFAFALIPESTGISGLGTHSSSSVAHLFISLFCSCHF